MIELDGSFGEGGGAILRTALCLSTITQEPFGISSIRKSRPEPGLKAQHLTAVKAFASLYSAKASGAAIHSTELGYIPGPPALTRLELDVGTAGSVTLILSSLLPALLASQKKTRLRLRGGTDVAWSPSWDYFAQVYVPSLSRFGTVECRLLRRGYYPAGGGEVHVLVQGNGQAPKPIMMQEHVAPVLVEGVSHAHADLETAKVAERMAREAEAHLGPLRVPVRIRTEYAKTASVSCGITLWARCVHPDAQAPAPLAPTYDQSWPVAAPHILGADRLGKPRTAAEEVGAQCAKDVLTLVRAGFPVDPHLADMLIPFMALAPGSAIATSRISDHVRSNIYVAERFLPVKFEVGESSIRSAAS